MYLLLMADRYGKSMDASMLHYSHAQVIETAMAVWVCGVWV